MERLTVTTRATARHRASVRPASPLSSLTNVVTDHVGTIGRGGVVIAMSSGLVATMGLPAQALGQSAAGPEAAAPATAPIAVQPALAFQSGLLAAPASAQSSAAPLSAPAAATVEFESSAFTAVPKKIVAPTHSSSSSSSGKLSSTITTSAFGSARGSSVLSVAARYIGVPYVYGGTTPRGWDCSGAVGYIFAQIGVKLPRTANEQMLASKRVSSSQARAGDLVFFVSAGRAYHVGIVAGDGMMYDAQRTGKAFTKRAIYSSTVLYGRV
jgi:cell wall-associated NlpC family hydrolase